MTFNDFAIRVIPKRELLSVHGLNATARAAAIVDGVGVNSTEGPHASALLPSRGPAPALYITHHMWAAGPKPRVIPLVFTLASVTVDEVDLWVRICRGAHGVEWEIRPRSGARQTFHFDPDQYDRHLRQSIQDRSWEDWDDRTIRMVREGCSHGLLHSRGLRWNWGGWESGHHADLLLDTEDGKVASFCTSPVETPDAEAAAMQILEQLHTWVRKGAPGPRSYPGGPDWINSIDLYP